MVFRRSFLVVASICLLPFSSPGIDTNRHVILITVDGGGAFYFNDPKAPLPNLRKLAANGVVAKGMRVANPSVTWPNHTTLVTGVTPAKHSVLHNGLMITDAKEGFVRDQERSHAELIRVPTVFGFLHAKGFKTAGVNWPCTPKSTTLDFNLPDLPNQLRFTSPEFLEELTAAKILDDASAEAFKNKTGAGHDQIWADTACFLLRKHRPNFMLLHFLISDSTQHRLGPQCHEAYEALGLVDAHIGKVLATLDEIGIRENTSIIVTADHGFIRVHKQIVAGAVLRNAGLWEDENNHRRVQIVSMGGTAMVYLHSKATKDADYQNVISLFKRHEGIERVLEPKHFSRHGFPTSEQNPLMADLVLAAKDGYSFSPLDVMNQPIIPTREGGIGAHGYLAKNPKMNALFIAQGRGIAKGKKIGFIENVDIAPTIAHLFGENFSNAEGKVLKHILVTPKR